MKPFAILATVLLWRATVNAHMDLVYPVPFRSPQNPNTPSGKADYSMTAPLKADGSDFPCKGYQVDFGTPAGNSVATWAAGGKYNFSVAGGASHNGGSCQVALSYDGGKSFTTVQSYIGGCPLSPSFDFQVPSDAKTGSAIFAWTWFNNVGNREMYMNCASVTITGAAKKKRAGTSFASRPSIFVANIGNGCTTTETTDVVFPDPGPDVANISKAPGQVKGTCQAVRGIGGGSNSDSGSKSSSIPDSSTTLNTVFSSSTSSAISPSNYNSPSSVIKASPFIGINLPSSSSIGFVTITTSDTLASPTSSGAYIVGSAGTSAAVSSASPSGALKQSTDGSCGNGVTCLGRALGTCCSELGWCGDSDLHCGPGCQAAYGDCHGSGGNLTAKISNSAAASSSSAAPSHSAAVSGQSSAAPSNSTTALGYFVTAPGSLIMTQGSSTATSKSCSTALSSSTTSPSSSVMTFGSSASTSPIATTTAVSNYTPGSSGYMASYSSALSNLTTFVTSSRTGSTRSSTFIPLIISDLLPTATSQP